MAIFWDDIEILQVVDEATRDNPGAIYNGWAFMQTVASKREATALEADYHTFVRELFALLDAGLLTWRVQGQIGGAAPPDPRNPNYYLQQIDNIALTIPGRDRARGQIVRVSLPEPAEDDGRMIRASTLDDVAGAIAEPYTQYQAKRLLSEAGISAEHIPEPDFPDTSSLLHHTFVTLAEGSCGERRELRHFLGAWLDNWLHSGPTAAQQDAITRDLARQGWFVHDGRLIVGEPVRGAAAAVGDLARDTRLAALHDHIREVAQKPFEASQPAAAVFEAFKAVNGRVQELTGLDLDGRDLMAQTFGDKAPRLLLAQPDTKTGASIQDGYRFLFMGAMAAIRNPHAHETSIDVDENEALEQLALASLLMRRLDEAFSPISPDAESASPVD
ncbi:MAG: TIGR02391 family protein [Solirubrobacteraceae bacterium]|jgi:uncharacterized protein (TIGR02391 family)